MKKLMVLITIAASAVLLLAGCSPSRPSGGSKAAPGTLVSAGAGAGGAGGPQGRRIAPIRVQAVSVEIGNLTVKNDTAGSVMPFIQSAVASQIAGVVAGVRRQAGDWVQAGETVVQLDDSQLKLAVQNAETAVQNAEINYAIGKDNANQSNPKLGLQVQSAQSALASARKNYESQNALFALGGVSASALDSAKSALEQAQANLEAAKVALDQNQKADTQTLAQLQLVVVQAKNQMQLSQLNLQNAAIKAPFAGQIAAVNVNPGMYVGLNTSVFILVSAEREIDFTVSPPDAPNLPVGTTVQFSYQGGTYPVKISKSPSAPINGVVPMVAAVPKSIALAYGTVGTVSYTLTIAKGALLPIAALETNEDQNYVYAIEGDKAITRQVTILGESGTTAAVAGVEQGLQVIVNAPPGLLAGSPVQPIAAGNGQAGGKAPSSQAAPGGAPNGQAPSGQPSAGQAQALQAPSQGKPGQAVAGQGGG